MKDIESFLKELGPLTSGANAPERVKTFLEEELVDGLDLPDRFCQADPDCYARHLLARFDSGATAIVMVWGVDQQTPLHDHAGIWCVEGVVKGRIDVTRYDLVEEKDDAFCFESVERLRAGKGQAGALIPPVEHHVISNGLQEPSITLHVYGGEMDHCQIFLPANGKFYRKETRALHYTTRRPLLG